jgi:hypothetical protein
MPPRKTQRRVLSSATTNQAKTARDILDEILKPDGDDDENKEDEPDDEIQQNPRLRKERESLSDESDDDDENEDNDDESSCPSEVSSAVSSTNPSTKPKREREKNDDEEEEEEYENPRQTRMMMQQMMEMNQSLLKQLQAMTNQQAMTAEKTNSVVTTTARDWKTLDDLTNDLQLTALEADLRYRDAQRVNRQLKEFIEPSTMGFINMLVVSNRNVDNTLVKVGNIDIPRWHLGECNEIMKVLRTVADSVGKTNPWETACAMLKTHSPPYLWHADCCRENIRCCQNILGEVTKVLSEDELRKNDRQSSEELKNVIKLLMKQTDFGGNIYSEANRNMKKVGDEGHTYAFMSWYNQIVQATQHHAELKKKLEQFGGANDGTSLDGTHENIMGGSRRFEFQQGFVGKKLADYKADMKKSDMKKKKMNQTNERVRRDEKQPSEEKKSSKETKEECWACGMRGHSRDKCILYNGVKGKFKNKPHPDVNKEDCKFLDSAVGKKWKEKGKDYAPFATLLNGNKRTGNEPVTMSYIHHALDMNEKSVVDGMVQCYIQHKNNTNACDITLYRTVCR